VGLDAWKQLRGGQSSSSKRPAADQYLPGESRNVSYISRLECIQAAVRTQIDRLAIEQPDRKVVIITFNNDVVICGSAHNDITITGDRLDNFDELFSTGTTGIQWDSVAPVSSARDALKERVCIAICSVTHTTTIAHTIAHFLSCIRSITWLKVAPQRLDPL
jgi:hypothetical protein